MADPRPSSAREHQTPCVVSWYADLSPYTYLDSRRVVADDDGATALNIGWLGAGIRNPTGPAHDGFLPRLLELARHSHNQTRGRHICALCDDPPAIITITHGLHRVGLGSSEIHVPGGEGIVYAAPTMICHYVAAHEYLPPQEFVDAVMRT